MTVESAQFFGTFTPKLDEKGRPLGVYEKVMGPANWLIEEFMLLANKRVAAWTEVKMLMATKPNPNSFNHKGK